MPPSNKEEKAPEAKLPELVLADVQKQLVDAQKDLQDARDYNLQADQEIENLKLQLAGAQSETRDADAELDSAKAHIEKLETELLKRSTGRRVEVREEGNVATGRRTRVCPPQFRGSIEYVVGPRKFYRDGRIYTQGSKVTLVDQAPTVDMVKVGEPGSELPASIPVAPLLTSNEKSAIRAADKNVGG